MYCRKNVRMLEDGVFSLLLFGVGGVMVMRLNRYDKSINDIFFVDLKKFIF